MNRKILIILFFISLTFSFSYLYMEKENNIDEHIKETTAKYEKNFNFVYVNLKKFADIIYETEINTKEIQDLLAQVDNADSTKRNEIREELYTRLFPIYDKLKKQQIKQLHFHLPNNDSFLRFHRPQKFGDNLTKVRPTVAYVNKYKKAIDGFEEGRIYNGFRFVYPIFKGETHLGSVEVSFSSLFVNIEMMEHFDIIGKILIDASLVSKKVWEDEQSNYGKSKIDGFLFEKDIAKILKGYNKKDIPIVVSKNTIKEVHKNKDKKEAFSIYDKDSDTIMSFIKLVNPITQKNVGLLVMRNDSSYIKEQEFNFYKFAFGNFLLFLVIFVSINRTINERKRLQQQVEEKTKELVFSNNQLKEYVELIDKNVISSSTNLKGIITDASSAFSAISGYSKEELIGKNHNIIRHPDMESSVFKEMWETLEKGDTWKGEVKNARKDGGFYWVDATISPSYDYEGNHIGYTAIRQNITDKKHIEEIAITDGLTHIFNRRHFNYVMPRIINTGKRKNVLISLIILDIDHFKQYNDTYGHQMGDDVLIEVAKVLVDTLKRSSDMCFRIGGEEFAVVYLVDEKEQSLQFANIIRKNIENLQLEHKSSSVGNYITASLGLVCKYANEIDDEDSLFKEADDNLYKAKELGRNRVASNLDIN